MTLEEGIKHCEEVADTCELEASKYDLSDSYESYIASQEGECAEQHRQLAEWLKDYKRLKEQQLNDDCVSRAELKDEAIRLWNGGGDEDYKFSTLIDYITDLPPITLIQNWIPISVKPPKDKQRCFVTQAIPGCKPIVTTTAYSTNLYEVNRYEFADKKNIPGFYNYGSDGYFECTDVIAWMPSPEAYEGEEN